MQPRDSARGHAVVSERSRRRRDRQERRLPIVLRVLLRLFTFAHPPTPAWLRLVAAKFAIFTPRFVALSPAFTLFVQPIGVGSQSLRNGALDGFLALWIAHAPYLRFTPRIAAISAASPRTCEPASHVR